MLALPAGEVVEPFLDVDDIADVVIDALTDDRHVGKLYELTGPRLLTFADAAAEIAAASGGPSSTCRSRPTSSGRPPRRAGLPAEDAAGLAWLFGEIFDGRNESLADGVQQALGRPPRDFSDYVRRAAATGVWSPSPCADRRTIPLRHFPADLVVPTTRSAGRPRRVPESSGGIMAIAAVGDHDGVRELLRRASALGRPDACGRSGLAGSAAVRPAAVRPAVREPPTAGGCVCAGAPVRAGPMQPVGVVPQTVGGPYNSVGLVILLTIVTCGIWGAFWTYRTSEDLKKYNGDGLGGVLGLVIYLLLSVVLMFTIPSEIEKMYQRDGAREPGQPARGPVVPAADHRQHHLVREGPERAQRVLGQQGRPHRVT